MADEAFEASQARPLEDSSARACLNHRGRPLHASQMCGAGWAAPGSQHGSSGLTAFGEAQQWIDSILRGVLARFGGLTDGPKVAR